MKKNFILLFVTLIVLKVEGQNQSEAFIKEAQDFLAKKEYKQAQLSLQDAINEINMMLAKQVAESLPAEINGLKAEGEGEVGGTGMGMIGGGMQITKRYSNAAKPENNAEVQIIANSPMISAMNMYLTNPGMAGAGYKSVRVGTTRAISKTDLQDAENGAKTRSTEIQIPIGQTLITIRVNGFATEQDELSFATKLDVEKIRTALGE
jgi:hypothetical protein